MQLAVDSERDEHSNTATDERNRRQWRNVGPMLCRCG